MIITSFKQRSNRQAGMVSIMITLVLMLVISLIVLGFAQISRLEQRQSLDRQLSAQAYYAAESGVNDARSTIRTALAAGDFVPEKDECETTANNPDTNPYAFDPVIDAANNVAYTCMLVTTKLKTISASLTAGGKSAVLPLHPDNGSISRIDIKWLAPAPVSASAFAQCPAVISNTAGAQFPRSTEWRCPYGVLRLDIVPTDTYNRASMIANRKTMFFYPIRSAAGAIVYTSSDGSVNPISCSTTQCMTSITNMPRDVDDYDLRLQALYVDGTFDIQAFDPPPTSSPIMLLDAQAQIDVTGKADDVLRRIQVRIPLVPNGKYGDYGVVSGSSVCKRFSITPNTIIVPADIVGQDPSNPSCRPLSIAPIP